ncbi:MAG: hypothetical protein WDN46_10080 [Methylocella sp.]
MLFKISPDLAVNCAPSGKFHGWLFRKHPDGQWVSVQELEAVSDAEAFGPMAALLPPRVGSAKAAPVEQKDSE